MEVFEKLRVVASGIAHEEEGVPPITLQKNRTVNNGCAVDASQLGVFHAQMGNGKTIPLLKSMLTTACENNCNYCIFRRPRNLQRYSFAPEEMADAFMKMARSGKVQGIFLSSGVVGGGPKSQDHLIKTIEILRTKLHYGGYIHLKVMPGAEESQVERSMELCDRVSINLEGVTSERLKFLAPMKNLYGDLFPRIQMMDRFRKNRLHNHVNEKTASITTQLVVGVAGETDVETLQLSEVLYKQYGLARVYYSGFQPAADTPLESYPGMDYARYIRLYQASFLLRDYGFGMEELPFRSGGFLPLDVDPKLALARENLSEKPVEVNQAEIETLLRIPGIGKLGAERICNSRKERKLTDLQQLANLGIAPKRAAPFILLDGHKPVYQMDLWNYAPSALSEVR
jgi:predicted DNA-binding helix-hairpin-helix protein